MKARPTSFLAILRTSCLSVLLGIASAIAGEANFTEVRPALTSKQAIEVAMREVRRLGIDLSMFNAPIVNFVASPEPARWYINFERKVVMPGGFFTISVEDKSKAVFFFLGM